MATYLPYPTSQEEMATYQEKYTFDPTTKTAEYPTGVWYDPAISGDLITRAKAAVTELGALPPTTEFDVEIPTTIPSGALTDDITAPEGDTNIIDQLQTDTKQYDYDLPSPPDIAPTTTVPTSYEDFLGERQTFFGGLMDRFKGLFTPDKPLTEVAKEMLPEIPARLTQLDTQLAQLRTSYQTGAQQIEEQTIPMRFITGQQQSLERRYEIKKQGILLEREAIQGEYDRALDRVKTMLGLEVEDRKAKRETQREELNLLLAEASAEEEIALRAYERQLDRQDAIEDRNFQLKVKEQDDIMKVIAATPEAFAGKNWPTSIEEALSVVSQYKTGATALWPTGAPTSYKEWQLAGSPGTFEEWLKSQTTTITQSVLNKLAASGVPNDIAIDIQGYYNAGNTDKEILKGMIAQFGEEKAVSYMNAYSNVMAAQGTFTMAMPRIQDFQATADALKTEEEEAEKAMIKETTEETHWWDILKFWD